ncbi:MAG: winged helix-turn-helix transcriptional regulator [Oscillospiraceae bacterium]
MSPLIGARSDKSVIPFSIIKVLILRDLISGTKRFGERKKTIGSVSQKVLTAQLRDMEESGLVSRKVYAEVPPRVEYSLTELGQNMKPILDAMQCCGGV